MQNPLCLPEPARFADEYAAQANKRLDNLTKPLGSLGDLELVIRQLAGIQRRIIPQLQKPHFLVFAADHGVAAAHQVSRYGQEVTEEMAVNMAMGSSVSAVLARQHNIPLRVIDVGICRAVRHPGVIARKIANGTSDFTQGPAMTHMQLAQAIQAGIAEANRAMDAGADLLLLGELGIGNTTSATALAAWLLDEPVSALVGRGTGVDDEGIQRKTGIIETALEVCHTTGAERDWVDGFAQLGGFELAAIAGAMLAGAARRVPTLLDGLMTGVAALWALKMAPALAPYLFAGHLSPEPAHKLILAAIGCRPLLSLSLRVGEGTGALFAWPMLAGGLKVMAESSTFADARVTNPHQDESVGMQMENINTNLQDAPVAPDFNPAEREAVYKAIFARRDIRVFLPQPLDKQVVSRILQAGHHGPSVGYMQPWNFIVIEEKDVLFRLQQVVDKARVEAGRVYADAKRDYYLRLKVEGLVEAPLTICVTNDSTRGGPHVLGRHTIPETDLMSTACAIENMWLAARAEGVAMGWVSIYEKQDVRDVLSIPTHVDPCALLTLGYTPHFPDIPVLERVGWGERLQLDALLYQNEWGALPEK